LSRSFFEISKTYRNMTSSDEVLNTVSQLRKSEPYALHFGSRHSPRQGPPVLAHQEKNLRSLNSNWGIASRMQPLIGIGRSMDLSAVWQKITRRVRRGSTPGIKSRPYGETKAINVTTLPQGDRGVRPQPDVAAGVNRTWVLEVLAPRYFKYLFSSLSFFFSCSSNIFCAALLISEV